MMMMNTHFLVSAGILAISRLSKDLDQSGSSLIRIQQTMFQYGVPYHNLLSDKIDENEVPMLPFIRFNAAKKRQQKFVCLVCYPRGGFECKKFVKESLTRGGLCMKWSF